MRDTVVALLMLGTVAAVSAFSQQRSCRVPFLETPESSDTGEIWDGTPAFLRKALWKAQY